MLRPNLPASTSTDWTRTCTSWPTSNSSSTLSTKPSLICVMCTRPSASVPSSAFTVTKAPKGATRATLPLIHESECMPSKGARLTGSRDGAPPPPPPKPGSFIESDIRPRPVSTEITRHFTCWPASTTSSTLLTKPSWSCEMCTRPSAVAPPGAVTETKAPKGIMVLTVPSIHSSSERPSKAVKSAGALAPPPPPPILPSTIVRPNLPSSRNSVIQTSTSCPSST
mmetsp:Transcript_54688/g.146402  ORF Transcript_54688/g.146402 Transcript_54688/m.146402 type:complete len:225 (-) Transcript_54688:417-1091(-)